MDWEILAYIGAPLMVVLAFVAYRYWNTTASYALRMRESNARKVEPPAEASAPEPAEAASSEGDDSEIDDFVAAEQEAPAPHAGAPGEISAEEPSTDGGKLTGHAGLSTGPGETEDPLVGEEEAEDPPDDELKPNDSGQIGLMTDPGAALIKELDEQLAGLPSGIELIDLPILERRRIADRRDELLNDRERLLEKKKRGAHRRRRSRTKNR